MLIHRCAEEKAVEVLEEAVSRDPGLERAHYYLVVLYSRLGQPDRGLVHARALEEPTQHSVSPFKEESQYEGGIQKYHFARWKATEKHTGFVRRRCLPGTARGAGSQAEEPSRAQEAVRASVEIFIRKPHL